MIIGISQPTFMPYAGYFGLLDYVDCFVFLDDVQFDKRSWQQRNYIFLDKKAYLLTVPVLSKGKFHQKISNVKILNNKSKEKILLKIHCAYKNSKFFSRYFKKIKNIFEESNGLLLDLNIKIIKFLVEEFGISTKLNFLSKTNINSKKIKLIYDICKKFNATEYISTIGAKDYMGKIREIPNTSIKINYFKFNHKTEYSKNQQLSAIDLLFNEGPNSINIIRRCFKIEK